MEHGVYAVQFVEDEEDTRSIKIGMNMFDGFKSGDETVVLEGDGAIFEEDTNTEGDSNKINLSIELSDFKQEEGDDNLEDLFDIIVYL